MTISVFKNKISIHVYQRCLNSFLKMLRQFSTSIFNDLSLYEKKKQRNKITCEQY